MRLRSRRYSHRHWGRLWTTLFAIRGLPVRQGGHWGTQCVSQHSIPGWLLIMCRPLSGDCAGVGVGLRSRDPHKYK